MCTSCLGIQTCNQVIACDVTTEIGTSGFREGWVQLPREFYSLLRGECGEMPSLLRRIITGIKWYYTNAMHYHGILEKPGIQTAAFFLNPYCVYQVSKFAICLLVPNYSQGNGLFWTVYWKAVGCPLLGTEVTEKTVCSVPSGGPLLYENITFVYNSEQLNGTQRVLLDNVLSEEQCRELHSVASVRTRRGQGGWRCWPGGTLQMLWFWSRLNQRTGPEMSLSLRKGCWLWRHVHSLWVGMTLVVSRSGYS